MSQIRMRGFDPDDALIEWAPRDGETDLRLEDLEATMAAHGDSIALMLLPGVQYYNGQLLDMPALCRVARQAGAVIGFDLAHAIGNVPLSLHDWAPDFAAWCSYKYLNGGPGLSRVCSCTKDICKETARDICSVGGDMTKRRASTCGRHSAPRLASNPGN
jgi:kynureninase